MVQDDDTNKCICLIGSYEVNPWSENSVNAEGANAY